MTRNTFPRAALTPDDHVRAPIVTEQPLERLGCATGAENEPLHGWYFTVTPVGTIETVDSSPPATFLAGDGMVFRIALSPGRATARRELVVDPTYVAQEVLRDRPEAYRGVAPYEAYGVAIVSLGLLDGSVRGLGSRVLSNTSVHAIRHRDVPLLLVTTDGGRPMVVDPRTLRTVGALGHAREWRPAMLGETTFPFVNTTAHPAYDSRTRELFTVEFARDLIGTLNGAVQWATVPPSVASTYVPEVALAFVDLQRIDVLGTFGNPPADDAVVAVPVAPPAGITPMGTDPTATPILALSGELVRALRTPRRTSTPRQSVGERLIAILASLYATIEHGPFTRLKRWNADFEPPRDFDLVLPDGTPITIVDSIHQLAVTKSYVVFADTRFKFAMTLVLSNLLEEVPRDVARIIRKYLSTPQLSSCPLYFVPRASLEGAASTVVAYPVVLDSEVVHFFADHDDADGERVVLWVAHQCAMDGAEFVATSDVNAGDEPVDRDLVGMFPMSLDLNNLTRYELSPRAAQPILGRSTLESREHTWAIGIGAGPGIGTLDGEPTPPDRIAWTTWYNEGFLPELLTRHVYRMYRGYKGRSNESSGDASVDLGEIRREILEGGTPGSLFKAIRGSDGELSVETVFGFAPGMQIVSPQYVPPPRGHETHPGFVVCVVFRSEKRAADERLRELWVFRADALATPILRFDAMALGWQYTLHTAWLADLGGPASDEVYAPFAFTRDQVATARPAADPLQPLLDEVFRRLAQRETEG